MGQPSIKAIVEELADSLRECGDVEVCVPGLHTDENPLLVLRREDKCYAMVIADVGGLLLQTMHLKHPAGMSRRYDYDDPECIELLLSNLKIISAML